MSLLRRIRSFVDDLLPAGDFWADEAAKTFAAALAGAVEPLAKFADGLRAAVFPGSADRSVLLQWWAFVRSDCAATPTDTEELRAAVIAAISSPPGHTIAGLRKLVAGQGLPFVELRHRLPISELPMPVPSPVNPHARILEVWNSPLLHNVDQVRCIVREFAQAADVLRFVAPRTEWRGNSDRADRNVFSWTHCPDSVVRFERREALGGPLAESVSLALPAEHGQVLASNVFAVGPDSNIKQAISWEITRELNDTTVVHERGLFAIPTAVPVCPVAVTEGSVVPCGGSDSRNATVFTWDVIGRPEIGIEPGEFTSFIAPLVEGFATVQVRLTVTNKSGATDSAIVNIVVVTSA